MYLGQVVERATPSSLWREPFHPYSSALIAAAPAHDGRGNLPQGLPGEVPDPADPPHGCRFHPRCKFAFAKCSKAEPALISIRTGRYCACWLHEAPSPSLKPQKTEAS
jgi:peptide/nickel transport system ATP-binding protein